jgi:uncharacterized protein YjbJ (UPF0337 family)
METPVSDVGSRVTPWNHRQGEPFTSCREAVRRTARNTGGRAMNQDQASGKWKQVKGKIKEQWGKLTDDDLTVLEGNRDQLAGKVQERYGLAKEEAEKQVRTFRDRYKDLEW